MGTVAFHITLSSECSTLYRGVKIMTLSWEAPDITASKTTCHSLLWSGCLFDPPVSFSSYCHNHASLHLLHIVNKYVNTSDLSSVAGSDSLILAPALFHD